MYTQLKTVIYTYMGTSLSLYFSGNLSVREENRSSSSIVADRWFFAAAELS